MALSTSAHHLWIHFYTVRGDGSATHHLSSSLHSTVVCVLQEDMELLQRQALGLKLTPALLVSDTVAM